MYTNFNNRILSLRKTILDECTDKKDVEFAKFIDSYVEDIIYSMGGFFVTHRYHMRDLGIAQHLTKEEMKTFLTLYNDESSESVDTFLSMLNAESSDS